MTVAVEEADRKAAADELAGVFTEEERAYILLVSRDAAASGSRVYRLIGNLAFFIPATLIGAYGIYAGDAKIIGIGFMTLLASIAWAYFGEIRNWRYEALGQSVLAKLATLLESRGGRQ